jgi:hypothetical protein
VDFTTPHQIIQELNRLMQEMPKGIQALHDAELKVAQADADYERALAAAFLDNQGSVADRQAVAKLKASDHKLALDIAKAELNRIKAKLRAIDSAQVAVSVISRLVEMEYKAR